MVLRTSLDKCGKPRFHRDSILGLSSPYAVAIPTEVPGPHLARINQFKQLRSQNMRQTQPSSHGQKKTPKILPRKTFISDRGRT